MMKLKKLEIIRGFASVYVVVYHLLMNTKIKWHSIDVLLPFRFGQEAVILFFLLSGFVIQYSFEHSTDKSFSNYFFKRFTRIYIPLLFVYPLSYLLKAIAEMQLIPLDLTNLLANIFMLQDVAIKPNILAGTYMGNTPLWSLSYEWWFYMLFYLLYKWGSQKQIKTIVILLVLSSGLSYVFYPCFFNRIIYYFGIWWVGVELANAYMTYKSFPIKKMYFPLVLLLGCVLISLFNVAVNYKSLHGSVGTSPILELRHFSFALVAVSIALLWNHFAWTGFNTFFAPFLYFTPISYTIYISHWPLLIDREYLFGWQSSVWGFMIAIALTLIFAYTVEVLVYPFIRSRLHKLIFRR